MQRIPIQINSAPEKYDVVLADSVLNRIEDVFQFSPFSKVVVLTDTTLEKIVLPQLQPVLPKDTTIITVQPGEHAKSVETAMTIWNQMLACGMDRKSLLINVGGGVITDLGAFVASTYMRGIAFVQIPTTLLAQVDASVGGKTGVNFGGVKNIIGTFNQPYSVIIDVATLKTLSDREFSSGFAEILKHGLIRDIEYFKFVSIKKPRDFTPQELINIIEKSVKIKADIISGDIKELTGSRKLLNFGHTIGHAIESTLLELNTPILHGEAVSLGMLAEAKLSELRGSISASETEEIKASLVKAGLPVSLPNISIETIMQKMKFDKKNEKGIIKFTLLQKMGQALADCEVSEENIQAAFGYLKG